MIDFSSAINLPLIFAIIIALAIFLYVLLDGFDLGIGILFPFAPSDKCRDRMMNSIAPFWDGNETWLALGGAGLFAAFPLAYSILMPAFYIPIIIMLIGLIMRGVAFEFRFKASGKSQCLWDYSFHFGSLIAAFFQGVILGGFVDGLEVGGRDFIGSQLAWATPFSITTGIALLFGYSLIGSTWLIMKTEDITHDWARKVASYVSIFVAIFIIIVGICMPYLNPEIKGRWFDGRIHYFLIIGLIFIALFIALWHTLIKRESEISPFFITISIFLLSYIGLAFSFYPWIIPFKYNIWDAAASAPSLSLMLIGVVPLLPIILGYTAYCYYIFKGKASHEHYY